MVTLLESITDGNSKKSEILSSLYQAQHIGFDEDEASHIHSFKLIVPSILGVLQEGDKPDTCHPLASVKDFTSWNPQDNEGGVKKWI